MKSSKPNVNHKSWVAARKDQQAADNISYFESFDNIPLEFEYTLNKHCLSNDAVLESDGQHCRTNAKTVA